MPIVGFSCMRVPVKPVHTVHGGNSDTKKEKVKVKKKEEKKERERKLRSFPSSKTRSRALLSPIHRVRFSVPFLLPGLRLSSQVARRTPRSTAAGCILYPTFLALLRASLPPSPPSPAPSRSTIERRRASFARRRSSFHSELTP